MGDQSDRRERAALTDGERHRKELAENKDRVLRALEDEKSNGSSPNGDGHRDDGVEPEPGKRTMTYRGATVEVDSAPTGPAVAPHQPMMYRGVPIGDDGAGPEERDSIPKSGKRWGRKAKRDTPDPDSTEEKLRRLKRLLDEGILTDEEFAAKKAELLDLL